MHPTADHQTFRSLAEQGKITVDHAVARRFFMDSRMSSFRDAIGKPYPLVCGATFTTFWLSPVCLLASFYFAYQFFGLWSLAVIPVSGVLWFLNLMRCSVGSPGVLLVGFALAYLIWVNLIWVNLPDTVPSEGVPIYRCLVLIIASVLLTRTAYRVSSFFFVLLVLRNSEAFDLLRDAIYVQEG